MVLLAENGQSENLSMETGLCALDAATSDGAVREGHAKGA
jgi:hypothetical protein